MKRSVLVFWALSVSLVLSVSAVAMAASDATAFQPTTPLSRIVQEAVPGPAPESNLKPDVQAYIQTNFLAHKNEYPDPNEPLEALKLYVDTRGKSNAVAVFKNAVKRFPDSRHIRFGLADALWSEFQTTKDQATAAAAFDESTAAAKMGIANGRILYLWLVTDAGVAANKVDQVDQFYQDLLQQQPESYVGHLEYAKFLARTNNATKAMAALQDAISLRPAGNVDAVVMYGEMLIDRGQYDQAVQALTLPGERSFYADFLRGFALEKLGRKAEAKTAYARYKDMSQAFPAPDKYRSDDSALQEGISFMSTAALLTLSSGQTDLSWAIACEAGGEAVGGMRAVGWAIRQRATRGNDGCVDSGRSGSTLDDWYSSVVCYPWAFSGVLCSSGHVSSCSNANSRSSTSDQVASDVWSGWAPEPTYNWCPDNSGYEPPNACTGSCQRGNTTNYSKYTPHSFYSNSCSGFSYSCYQSVSYTCGDGSPDNCFFRTQ